MNEMIVAIAISKTLLNMSFRADMIWTTHNNHPNGIVMRASMNELIISDRPEHIDKNTLPIETNNTDESTTHSTNQDRLPPGIIDWSSHENIQISRSIINRDLVMDDIPVQIMGSK